MDSLRNLKKNLCYFKNMPQFFHMLHFSNVMTEKCNSIVDRAETQLFSVAWYGKQWL